MKTYCLTLKTTPDREKAAIWRFKEAGLDDVQFFYGIDGGVAGLASRDQGIEVSHYMLWLSLLTLGDATYLVLEDDAVPQGGWQEQHSRTLPDQPLLVALGCPPRPLTNAYLVNHEALELLVAKAEVGKLLPADVPLETPQAPVFAK